ncbi:hypothetical protein N8D56_09540 [Devosia sp. A8/3-2]|nr:hypothetical protein N8D56_09540 [Devosia sp. A8/3-2]
MTSTATGTLSKSLNGQALARHDAFAELLDDVSKSAPVKPAPASEPSKSRADDEDRKADDPRAVAAPVDSATPIQPAPPKGQLADLL